MNLLLFLLLHMITVTRLNGDSFTLNALFIEQIQMFPDTTITLTNGKKLIVQESNEQVKEKVIQFYKQIGLIGTSHISGEDSS